MTLDPQTVEPVGGEISVNQLLSRSRWLKDVVEPLAYIERRIAPQMIAVSGTIEQEQVLSLGALPELPSLGFEGAGRTVCCAFMRGRGPFAVAHYHLRYSAISEVSTDGGEFSNTTILPHSYIDGDVATEADVDTSASTTAIISQGQEITNVELEAISYDELPVYTVEPYLVILR